MRTSIMLLIGLMLSACSSVEVRPLSGDSKYTDGLLFYAPAPYLLVAKTDKGVSASIVMLPNKGERRVIKWDTGWFGSTHPKIALADGWNLTGFDADIKSGTAEVFSSIGELAGIFGLTGGPPGPATFQLYPLRWNDGDGVWQVGAGDGVGPPPKREQHQPTQEVEDE